MTTLLLVIGALGCCSAIRDNAFKFRVPAGWYECFYEDFHSNMDSRMELFYEVIQGGGMDIKIAVSSPDEAPILSPTIERKGWLQEVNTDVNGPYRICLDNTFSHISDKVVFINIIVHEKSDLAPVAAVSPAAVDGGAVNKSISTVLRGLNMIGTRLNNITIEQHHMQARDARHMKTAVSNLDRVFIWSFIETIAMVSMFVIQVVVIQSLFHGKRADGIRT